MTYEIPTSDSDLAQEELVAYLDGELPSSEADAVEQRLAGDPDYRLRLRQLQQAWDLLDALPQSAASPQFTRSTVEMVAIRAEQDVAEGRRVAVRRHAVQWVLGGAGIVATIVLGFLLASEWLQRPNRQLLRDLPLLEDFDTYRYADDINFLRELDKQGLFREEPDGESP